MSSLSNQQRFSSRLMPAALIALLCLSGLAWGGYTSEQVIINGGTAVTTGFLAPAQVGEDRITGSVSVIVGQPLVSTEPMTGGGFNMEVGFWSQMLRAPGLANLTASYEIYPDRIDLEWNYDPNTPPATDKHDIFRNDVIIRNDYPAENTTYTDDGVELNVGTEYNYKIKGKQMLCSYR